MKQNYLNIAWQNNIYLENYQYLFLNKIYDYEQDRNRNRHLINL